MAIEFTQESVPRYAVSAVSGRVKITTRPTPHVTLASSRVVRLKLVSSSPISQRGQTMDGIPQITVRQFQRVTLLSYVEDVDRTAITQATTQSVQNSVYRLHQEGGDPVSEFFSNVSDVIFDTVQKDAKDRDGYNVAVEFRLETDTASQGTATYQLETIVELTGGEHVPLVGRVTINPTYTLPINAY